MVDELARQDAPRLFPGEYSNLTETFEHGEAVLLVQKNNREADTYYLLALQKGELLKAELKDLKERQLLEERRLAAEKAAREEEERLMRKAAEAEARLLREQERLKAEEAARAAIKAEATAKENATPTLPLPSAYTVHRGETLPQIAARNEIYNDSTLWPLIYRANRDQIRDPKQLWPGQVLKIPRHFSKDQAIEAKRYSNKK